VVPLLPQFRSTSLSSERDSASSAETPALTRSHACTPPATRAALSCTPEHSHVRRCVNGSVSAWHVTSRESFLVLRPQLVYCCRRQHVNACTVVALGALSAAHVSALHMRACDAASRRASASAPPSAYTLAVLCTFWYPRTNAHAHTARTIIDAQTHTGNMYAFVRTRRSAAVVHN
jgi:hypothetical protein